MSFAILKTIGSDLVRQRDELDAKITAKYAEYIGLQRKTLETVIELGDYFAQMRAVCHKLGDSFQLYLESKQLVRGTIYSWIEVFEQRDMVRQYAEDVWKVAFTEVTMKDARKLIADVKKTKEERAEQLAEKARKLEEEKLKSDLVIAQDVAKKLAEAQTKELDAEVKDVEDSEFEGVSTEEIAAVQTVLPLIDSQPKITVIIKTDMTSDQLKRLQWALTATDPETEDLVDFEVISVTVK